MTPHPAARRTTSRAAVSVLTLVRGRLDHLANLVRGLALSDRWPDELVVARMGGPDPTPVLADAPCPVRVIAVSCDGDALPLAAARSAAGRAARGEHLIVLDVDCIPGAALVGAYDAALATRDALLMGGVRYLPAGAADGGWDESELARAGVEHSARQAPRGAAAPPPYELFWSLSFAVRRRTFLERLGGFDARFTGYGAEDTDFAFTARTAGVPLEWCAGAVAYHQDHEAYDPPLQHLHAIVANAVAFRRKWEVWPMEGWLRAFAEAGYVRWEGAALEVVAEPPPEALAAARRRAFPHG